MYILRGDITEDQLATAVSNYKAAFEAHGDVRVDEWGKRKMAFPMDHVKEGHYVLMTFNSDKATLAEVENRMKLDDQVLRYMVVRLEEKAPAAVE